MLLASGYGYCGRLHLLLFGLVCTFPSINFCNLWLSVPAVYVRNIRLSIRHLCGCLSERSVSKIQQMIYLSIVIGSAGGHFLFIQHCCHQIDLFQSFRLFVVSSLFNPTILRTFCVFYGCLNIGEIILFVQTPTLLWCRPESPAGLVLRSTKNASSFPPLQGDPLSLT